NVKFLIVGDISEPLKNYYYQKLKNLIGSLKMEQDVIFTGKRYDIPQLLSTFDIFVLPSIAEGTPIVILEAMAMEKTVVATDVGAVSEQILGGETGIIVPPRNPKAMAEAVIYLLEHSEERIRMGKKAREGVKEMFSVERCVEEHRKLYENIYGELI
ncbi:MAG: glycosyltransferase family 4 protein, partial [Thermoplasmatales archaeon]|nr:glycosyltransferase family 4 protein [Thermoplasmatales archaeon]